jgi:hypothetical protein
VISIKVPASQSCPAAPAPACTGSYPIMNAAAFGFNGAGKWDRGIDRDP